MKKLFLAAFLQTCIILCFAQLKSPDEFLGYQLGIKWYIRLSKILGLLLS
jgi:hypothetical protein